MFRRLRSYASDGPSARRSRTVSGDTPAADAPPPRYRRESPDDHALGIRVLSQPELASVDIIFVHGLGGHRQKTWSQNHDPDLFWPKLWLPFEPELGSARILTYGYNANWGETAKTEFDIRDFAKEMLHELSQARNSEDELLGIGTLPVIFVVHSMGGLVVKKFLMLGMFDERYKALVESVKAIIFLSTPHRGTSLAKTLNRILAVSFQSSKKYISDLEHNSDMIEDINETFRHVSLRLFIWSFYETLATSIGPKKIMVLEKDSSVLGYPAELSRPLRADHHGVCKYSSPTDNNYIVVRNAIKSLVSDVLSKNTRNSRDSALGSGRKSKTNMQSLFQDTPSPESDYRALQIQTVNGTCDWFLREDEIKSWIKPPSAPRVFWYQARPGSGKSTLAAYLIHHMKTSSSLDGPRSSCPFFFFKYSDSSKRSVANCLRSLACQLARDIPAFEELLASSTPQELHLKSENPSVLWQNVIQSRLFSLNLGHSVHWIIDGLDECELPRALIDLLHGLSRSSFPIHILFLSRNTDSISKLFDKLSKSVPVMRFEENLQDDEKVNIRLLVQHVVDDMEGSDTFKESLVNDVVDRSEGNMLWTKLVLDELAQCHAESQIRQVLRDVPDGMARLYQRMADNLVASTHHSNLPLIKTLLGWATCAPKALTLSELMRALQPEFSGFLNLKRTVKENCGQFLQVDGQNKITVLHQTTREYLTGTPSSPFYVDEQATHRALLTKMLSVFLDRDLRPNLIRYGRAFQSTDSFVFYSALHWPYHLKQSGPDAPVGPLLQFLRSPAVLTWIHSIALLRRLHVLVQSSKALLSSTACIKTVEATCPSNPYSPADLECLYAWATDLYKLAGKFGKNLVADPDTIYSIIPAFCSPQSVVYQQFYDLSASQIRVFPNATIGTTSSLGRCGLKNGAQAWAVSCSGGHVAVLGSTGTVTVLDSVDFTELATAKQDDAILAYTLSRSSDQLATYGLTATHIWDLPSGRLCATMPNLPNVKPLALEFTKNDKRLLLGGDDNKVRYIDLDGLGQGWQVPHPRMLWDTAGRKTGVIVSTPVCLVFSPDRAQVGASYRGAPLSVWSLDDGSCIGTLKHATPERGPSAGHRRPGNVMVPNWFPVDRLTWHPTSGHILGIYKDGRVFRWHPVINDYRETREVANEIAASPNGRFFATTSNDGIVRIWSFRGFNVLTQLSSNDLIVGLCFSPNSSRLYDLRGSWVNAWEPPCLTRSADNIIDDQSVATRSGISSKDMSQQPVSALAVSPDGLSYSVGYEDGRCVLFRRGSSDYTELTQFNNHLDIAHIVWSSCGTVVAVADLAGELQLKGICYDRGSDVPLVTDLCKPRLELQQYNIADMIFHPDSKSICIITGNVLLLHSVEDGALLSKSDLEADDMRSWISHSPSVLVGFGKANVAVHSWKDLHGFGPYEFGKTIPVPIERDMSLPGKIQLTKDRKNVALHFGDGSGEPRRELVVYRPTEVSKDADVPLLSREEFAVVPADLAALINLPLGVLPNNKIVFFDHDMWLCSCPLLFPPDDDIGLWVDRFYFIPSDWVNGKSLRLCTMATDGTVFWPRDGFVEMVECDVSGALIV